MFGAIVFVSFLCTSLAADHTGFIVNGRDVRTPGKWPWQGAMRRLTTHICGISLITDRWGLTAAHCVKDEDRLRIRFMFGSVMRDSQEYIVKADKMIMHPRYNMDPGFMSNDVALVKFSKTVNGTNIAPVPLAPPGSDHSGNTDCWITGFGLIYANRESRYLQEANVDVFSKTACKRIRGSMVNDGHICMGDIVNGRTSCSGDSGGPLVCRVNGVYQLVGVTSWGRHSSAGCPVYPLSVYSRVEYFNAWIRDTIRDN